MKITDRIGAGLNETATQAIQVIVDLRIIDIAGLTQPNLIHDALAHLPLQLGRQLGTRGLTQVWEIIR